MFPPLSINDVTNVTLGQIKNFGGFPVRHFQLCTAAYDPDLLFVKFAPTISFTNSKRPMTSFIGTIIFRCVPSKVVKSVVTSVSIFMARLHSFGTRANKSFENEVVYKPVRSLPVFYQTEMKVSMAVFKGAHQSWLGGYLPAIAKRLHGIDIAKFIGEVVWEIGNWFHNITFIKTPLSSLAYPCTFQYMATNPEAVL